MVRDDQSQRLSGAPGPGQGRELLPGPGLDLAKQVISDASDLGLSGSRP